MHSIELLTKKKKKGKRKERIESTHIYLCAGQKNLDLMTSQRLNQSLPVRFLLMIALIAILERVFS